MGTSERKIEAARQVADRLKAQGRHMEAEIIRSLCRSNIQLAGTASRLANEVRQLHADKTG